ncbi:MAG: adeC 2 [Verrucomicrobia bacterium]|nr:adeC 2 [Verrucomicrobiota bacterium]
MSVQRIRGRIVDVLNREEFLGEIELAGGVIRRITRNPKIRERRLLMPGLVDAHIHIESSMLPPAEFARHAVVHGTVATVSDPHEIANVLGAAGVRYMIADGRRTPFKFNFGAPSCVPATTFETAGARLDAPAVAKLLALPAIKFLAEVMNFPGVLNRDPELLAMIAAAQLRGKPVDGHAPGLRGAAVSRYAAAGISTDHECFTLAEAKDKLAAGMKILIREGSAARNFAALAPLLKTEAARCMFCCDDLHPDLLMKRHLDEHVRRALKLGFDRFDVIACATVNPVQHYKLKVGLLRVGDPADLIEVESWRNFHVRRTWLGGRLVANRGRALLPRRHSRIVNKFCAQPRAAVDFAMPAGAGKLNVIEALNGQLITRHVRVLPKLKAELAVADPTRDLLKIAVVNRYAPHAPVAVGFVRGFGLKAGALASSVAHDSHNIVAVGADDVSLAAAVNLVIAHRGGIGAVAGKRRRVLPLPIAGLMSDADGKTVARRYTALDAMAKKLGSKLDAPFMTLSFMALLVIPDLKLSDRGLFSGSQWKFL